MNEQKGHDVDWFRFLERIQFLYERHVCGPLFIETGVRFEDDLVKTFGQVSARYEILYGSGGNKLPNILMCWGAVPTKSPAGMTGFNVPYTTLSSLPNIPKSVFDCCVGLGTTAKICKKIEAVCYANELNPKRAAKTMKILNFERV